MDSHNEFVNFDKTDSNLKFDRPISNPLTIPARFNGNSQSNYLTNYNNPFSYQNNPMMGYYPMGGYNTSGLGAMGANNRVNHLVSDSFATVNTIVQTINAFNTVINTTYGAIITSVSTLAGVTEQIGRAKHQLMEIIGSISVVKIVKRLLLLVRRILSGHLPKMVDITSTISELQNFFKSDSANHSSNILSYLFFVTVICGPIVIYKFLKSISSATTVKESIWDSQIGKCYAAKVKADFLARNPDELSVLQGDIVTIAPSEFQKEVNWYLVSNLKGDQGLIPSSFVSILGVLNKNKNQSDK